jgi:hypothetical protein
MKPFWKKNLDPGDDPHFYARRMPPEYEAETRCSFCETFAPDVEHMIKTPFNTATPGMRMNDGVTHTGL